MQWGAWGGQHTGSGAPRKWGAQGLWHPCTGVPGDLSTYSLGAKLSTQGVRCPGIGVPMQWDIQHPRCSESVWEVKHPESLVPKK